MKGVCSNGLSDNLLYPFGDGTVVSAIVAKQAVDARSDLSLVSAVPEYHSKGVSKKLISAITLNVCIT